MLGGSYSNGFAPRDGVPRYPNQWIGCVSAWCPSLGPSGGVLRDWAGYKRDGTLTSMTLDSAWTRSEGKHALAFVRASSQYVSMPVFPAINEPLTITAWFRSDDTTNSQEVCMFGNVAAVDFYRLNINGAAQTVRAIATDSGTSRISTSSNTWTVNTWNFGVAVFTSITSRTAYLNGIEATPETTAATLNVPDVFSIGRSEVSGFPNYMSGMIDDVRIYNRELTRTEILAMYRQGRGAGYMIDTRFSTIEQAAAAGAFNPYYYSFLGNGMSSNV